MYKTLCVAVLLLPTFALTQARNPAVTPVSPPIVAKGKLLNQTAPIPTTTIFTPTQDGLYRLTVYATVTKSAPGSQSYWFYNIGWTDDAGPEFDDSILFQSGSGFGQFSYAGLFIQGGTVVPLEAKAGTSITYSMTQGGGSDNSAYSLYYTLERLE
jgi:hypothetical protein